MKIRRRRRIKADGGGDSYFTEGRSEGNAKRRYLEKELFTDIKELDEQRSGGGNSSSKHGGPAAGRSRCGSEARRSGVRLGVEAGTGGELSWAHRELTFASQYHENGRFYAEE